MTSFQIVLFNVKWTLSAANQCFGYFRTSHLPLGDIGSSL